MSKRRAALTLVMCLGATAANAQERGQTGLVMGLPATAGIIWHATDRLAIRPEIGFSHSTSESDVPILGSVNTSEQRTVTVGGSVLWYFAKADNVRPYFMPRISYGRSSFDSSSISTPPSTRNFGVSASFGAQYAPVRRFSVYGELGYGYGRTTTRFSTPILDGGETRTNAWSTRSAAGVIFYFN